MTPDRLEVWSVKFSRWSHVPRVAVPAGTSLDVIASLAYDDLESHLGATQIGRVTVVSCERLQDVRVMPNPEPDDEPPQRVPLDLEWPKGETV